jgi:cell division protein FtsL
MNKFNLFLEKHGIKIIIVLVILTYMKSCSVNSEVTKVKKQITVLDSLATKKDLEIEGLKSEKRMIQATDRKMMDVQRQSEIDKQIEILTK